MGGVPSWISSFLPQSKETSTRVRPSNRPARTPTKMLRRRKNQKEEHQEVLPHFASYSILALLPSQATLSSSSSPSSSSVSASFSSSSSSSLSRRLVGLQGQAEEEEEGEEGGYDGEREITGRRRKTAEVSVRQQEEEEEEEKKEKEHAYCGVLREKEAESAQAYEEALTFRFLCPKTDACTGDIERPCTEGNFGVMCNQARPRPRLLSPHSSSLPLCRSLTEAIQTKKKNLSPSVSLCVPASLSLPPCR